MIHAGAPSSPVILHVPHSSTTIPADVRRGILLDDAALDLELLRMTDAYTDRIAATAAADARTTPWRFVNGMSRLVIDPERFPDAREEMLTAGMGAADIAMLELIEEKIGWEMAPSDTDPEPIVAPKKRARRAAPKAA